MSTYENTIISFKNRRNILLDLFLVDWLSILVRKDRTQTEWSCLSIRLSFAYDVEMKVHSLFGKVFLSHLC